MNKAKPFFIKQITGLVVAGESANFIIGGCGFHVKNSYSTPAPGEK